MLVYTIKNEDVQKAIKSLGIGVWRGPGTGPDGYPLVFCRKCLGFIKEDVVKVINKCQDVVK